MDIDKEIAHIAAGQQGNIHRCQLLALGLDDAAIHWRVKSGRLYRVYRGVYGAAAYQSVYRGGGHGTS